MDQEAIARRNVLEIMLLDENAEPKELPLSLLEDITNGFSDDQRVGRGRFAVVYKGMLENGSVAVKKLSSTYTNENFFYQEVECLMKMKHKNVLRFLGYCTDVQERLLCFEYLPKGNLDGYITGPAFNGFEWIICCELIKGISKGLNYLHRNNIIHSDLKPSNILLDGNMVPKIADFQITRCYDEIQVEAVTSKLNGSVGYFAPELYRGRITTKSNIYSLGLVTREIMVGEKQSLNREEDLGKWKNMLDKMEGEAHFGQVLVYDKISQECIDFNPAKRPDTLQHILDRLDGTSSSDSLSVGQAEESCSSELQEGISMVPDEMSYKVREILGVVVVPIYNELLGVNPLELRFPFQPNKSILCSLQLTNNIDDQVPFRLMEKDSELSGYFPALPMYDVMPRRSTRTFILEMRMPEKRTEETEFYLILQSNLCKPAVYTFLQDSMLRDMFFDKTNSPGDSMHEVTLKAVLAPQGEITTQLIPPGMKTISVNNSYGGLKSMQVDLTNQWIITLGSEDVHIWNNDMQRPLHSFHLPGRKDLIAQFVARKQWLLILSDTVPAPWDPRDPDNFRGLFMPDYRQDSHEIFSSLHVYNWKTKRQELMRAVWIGEIIQSRIASLAVHPTQPYVLLADKTGEIMLLDWDNDWSCAGRFDQSAPICQMAFSPKETSSFATISEYREVKVWSIGSSEPKYSMSGHEGGVNCLDYFARGGQPYLITGSNDKTAKIWDMAKGTCVETLQTYVHEICSVSSHPSLPILLMGLADGAVVLFSSTNFRIDRVLHAGGTGPVIGLACLIGSRRVVIGQSDAITVIDIDNVDYQEESFDSSESNVSMIPGYETSEVLNRVAGALLDVHQLELQIPMKPHNVRCLVHLTNNTDECVAFRLMENTDSSSGYFQTLPLYGIVHPRSTNAHTVTMKTQNVSPEEFDFHLILHSSIYCDKPFESKKEIAVGECFFKEAKQLGKEVHEVTLHGGQEGIKLSRTSNSW